MRRSHILGDDIALAHAKDLDRDGQAGHLAAGTGLLDYDQYLGLLKENGYDGAVVLHGLSEAQVPFCTNFLREKIACAVEKWSRSDIFKRFQTSVLPTEQVPVMYPICRVPPQLV